MKTILGLMAGLLGVAGAALGTPQESVSFLSVNSNGPLNSPANSVLTHTFVGGYTLGRTGFSGTLTSLHTRTWRTDSRIVVQAPSGEMVTVQPFTTGTTFTTLSVTGSFFMPAGADPAGLWTFRFYESQDDGGISQVDARWDITFTTTDEPPQPPAHTDLGSILDAGATVSSIPVVAGSVVWYSFSLPRTVYSNFGDYLDIDTYGSNIPVGQGTGLFPNDTQIGLYDAAGNRIVSDDDDGDGSTSLLSFGMGGRPAIGNGAAFDGQDGWLPAGVYYLAVGPYHMTFGDSLWQVTGNSPGFPPGATATLRLRSDVTGPPLCAADYNGDGFMDGIDYDLFMNDFENPDPAEQIRADYNHDGFVDGIDYDQFMNDFETGC